MGDKPIHDVRNPQRQEIPQYQSGSSARQLILLATALLVVSSLIAIATGFLAVSIILAAAGLFFSPGMIVAYVAAAVLLAASAFLGRHGRRGSLG